MPLTHTSNAVASSPSQRQTGGGGEERRGEVRRGEERKNRQPTRAVETDGYQCAYMHHTPASLPTPKRKHFDYHPTWLFSPQLTVVTRRAIGCIIIHACAVHTAARQLTLLARGRACLMQVSRLRDTTIWRRVRLLLMARESNVFIAFPALQCLCPVGCTAAQRPSQFSTLKTPHVPQRSTGEKWRLNGRTLQSHQVSTGLEIQQARLLCIHLAGACAKFKSKVQSPTNQTVE